MDLATLDTRTSDASARSYAHLLHPTLVIDTERETSLTESSSHASKTLVQYVIHLHLVSLELPDPVGPLDRRVEGKELQETGEAPCCCDTAYGIAAECSVQCV